MAEHLSGHHRDTLEKIMRHPASHNIEWREVVSLLEAVGTVENRHDHKVEVRVGSRVAFFDVPAHKDVDLETVVDLRRMLTTAGYGE
jgi:hypothetical protein